MRVNTPSSIAPADGASRARDTRVNPSGDKGRTGEEKVAASAIEVTLSEEGSQVTNLLQVLRNLPNTRADMIARAKTRLQASEIPLNGAEIVDAMLPSSD